MAAHQLTLFISGDTTNARAALLNVERLCERVSGGCLVDVIDVKADPDLAEADRVIATPMLISRHTERPQRVVGDLSDLEAVIRFFEMAQAPPDAVGTGRIRWSGSRAGPAGDD